MINSVFTSFLVKDFHVFAFDYHLDRLEQNVQTVFGKKLEREWVKTLVLAQLPVDATLRVLITEDFSYQIEARTTSLASEIRCLTGEFSKESPEVKSANLTESLAQRKAAQDSGFDDLIWTKDSIITEGVFWNIYFWDGKNLITPKKDILPGICRRIFLENNLCEEGEVELKDLSKFQSVFYTNSSLLIGEILEINGISYQSNPELKDKLFNTLNNYMKKLD